MRVFSSSLLIAMLMSVALPDGACASGRDDSVVITAEDMVLMQASDTAELLNRIPGIKASETSVSIRGSYNVRVLVDGRSINDPTSYSGAVKWSVIPVERIEKRVVYKGQGGVAFGDNTEGGVIVITTRQTTRIGGAVGLHAGNNGEENADISLQGSIGRFAAGITAGARNYDGFTVNDDREERRVGMRLDYTADTDLSMFISGDYSTQKKGIRGYPESRTPNVRKNYDDYSLLFGLTAGKVVGRSWYRETTTRNSDSDKDFYSQLKVVAAGQSLKSPLMLPFVGLLDVGTGFEWQEASGIGFGVREEDRGWLNFSRCFARVGGLWSLRVGARGDLYSTFTNTLNPEARLVWSGKPWKIELTAGRTNSLPTFRQRYNETSTTRPNPELQMEKAVSTGCSFCFAPSEELSCELSLFHRDITDRITYVRAVDNTGQYENFGEVTYQGAESSLTWKPLVWLEFSPSYMYLHAKNESTGLWLPALPFHTLSCEVVLKPAKGFSLRTDLKYTGRVFVRTDNRETLPGYDMVNFRADYRTGQMQFHIDVDNLLDREYLYVDGYDAPPREWEIGMNYIF